MFFISKINKKMFFFLYIPQNKFLKIEKKKLLSNITLVFEKKGI